MPHTVPKKQQASECNAETRDREPIKDTSTIEAARNKRILPESVTCLWDGLLFKTRNRTPYLPNFLNEEVDLRLAEAEAMGVGFPVPLAPKCPENSEGLEPELELQAVESGN